MGSVSGGSCNRSQENNKDQEITDITTDARTYSLKHCWSFPKGSLQMPVWRLLMFSWMHWPYSTLC